MTAVPPVWARFARRVVLGAVGAGLVVALAGCGSEEDPHAGTNGLGKLPADQIEDKARAAAEGARAVRLSGTLLSQGRTYRIDMRLTGKGGVGEVSAKDGNRFELLRVSEDLYLKADAAFWEHQEHDGDEPTETDQEAARKLDGKYVKVPPEDPAYQQLSGFTRMDVLLDGVLAMNGERKTGDHGEVAGVRTIRVTADGGRGGAMDVSLVGRPYPLRLGRAGDAGVVLMSDWDKAFSLREPQGDQIVDYGKTISAAD